MCTKIYLCSVGDLKQKEKGGQVGEFMIVSLRVHWISQSMNNLVSLINWNVINYGEYGDWYAKRGCLDVYLNWSPMPQ